MNVMSLLDSLGRALHQVLRGLPRRTGFTCTAVLTLALGIGATTAIFAVVYSVLIKPLPYPDSSELVQLQHVAPGLGTDTIPMSPSLYFTYRDENETFEHLGIWTDGGATVLGVGDPAQARARWLTYGVLQALGIPPARGRWFSASDNEPGSDGPVPAILSHAYWQRKFGGDPTVVGRAMTIDSLPAEVVGVMPEGFRFLNMRPEAEVILPLRLDPSAASLGGFNFQGLGRLAPGITRLEAQADLERLIPIWLEAWPTPTGATRETVANWRVAPAPTPLKDAIIGDIAGTLWLLMGAIGAVLAIACANVTNLLLVRAETRRQEFAVRSTLGAGRGDIARELVVESLVLSAIGSTLGLSLAYAGIALLTAFGPPSLPRLQEVSVDAVVLTFVVVTTLVSSLLLSSLPVLHHTSSGNVPLRAGPRGATAGREQHRVRNGLVIGQVALALVLIVCSGLMLRTFMALRDVDPGFTRPESVQLARVALTPVIPEGPAQFTAMQRRMLEGIQAIPGVESASFAFGAPLEAGRTPPGTIYAQDRPYAAGETAPMRRFQVVAPGYFETLGTRFVAGRDLTWSDIETGGRVAVIAESLARELWGVPSAAIGKRIRETPPDAPGTWREIVGVVQDVHVDGVDRGAPGLVYWPVMMDDFSGQERFGTPFIAYVVRSERAGSASLVAEISQAVWSVNSELPVFLVSTLSDLYAGSLARTSFALIMLVLAGLMALGLGVVGIYGVMAYVVSQRTREIGIRLALGARPEALERMFVLRGLGLVAAGLAIGLVAAAASTRLMASELFGVAPHDAATYAGAVLALVAAATLASYLPARKAATIEPIETLRAE